MNIQNFKVYYFGSSEDGFNVYPESDLFSIYSDNSTPEPWIISIRRVQSVVYHNYIQYGLKTSHSNGRGGSYLGISVAMRENYFSDPKILYEEIFKEIITIMLKEKRIIKKNNFGQIAFIPRKLRNEEKYLVRWTEWIRRVFEDELSEKDLKLIPSSTPFTCEKFYRMNINKGKEYFQEYFEKYGAVDVSEIY